MQTLPLVSHSRPEQTIAWRNGTAISLSQFLADVDALAAMLPAAKHLINLCRDRYHFAVGLAAAIISNKLSLLPPTYAPEMVQQLQAFSADLFCLHDHDDYGIALPQLRYPAMPKHGFDFSLDGENKQLLIAQINVQQPVAILFTSGSGAAPSAHSKSWGSLVHSAKAQAKLLGLLPDKSYTMVATVPPQHMYGFESSVLLALQSGNALSHAQPFYPADICTTLQSIVSPRILVSTPLHLHLLLEAKLKLPELAMVLSATAPLSTALAVKVEQRSQAPLVEIYGSTETGQIATRRTAETSLWQLVPEVCLTPLAEQIWIEGGHIETPVPLNDIIETVDAEHFLLHGRQHDMVNIAGKRNSLANLNQHLNSIDGVIDGVFFMPEQTATEEVTRLIACVVAPSLSSVEILAGLRLRIDPVFLPRPLLLVAALPRNTTGKLPRTALQQLISAHMTDKQAD
jgi:acyl-coenzyme A synthetase/AMP-(fatty) acid ligase